MLCGGNPKNLSKALHDVALALDSKNKKRDEVLTKAFLKADHEIHKGQKRYDIALRPTPRQSQS
jgi:hypothetical protein